MTELKNILEKLRISMNFMDILQSPIPVKVAYGAVSRIEETVLAKASELKRFEQLNTIAKELESSFYNVKNKLEEAQKNGKGNEKCRDVFYPPNYTM